MTRLPSVAALSLAALVSGCGSAPSKESVLLPAGFFLAADAGYIKLPMLSAAAALYVVMDPLAPNWTIEEARQADDRYLIALRHKAVHSGGGGEARQVFARRAAQLGRQPGFEGYEIVSWEQGIESNRPFAQRVAFGEVRLIRAVPPLATHDPDKK